MNLPPLWADQYKVFALRGKGVQLADGRFVPADLVVLAIGALTVFKST